MNYRDYFRYFAWISVFITYVSTAFFLVISDMKVDYISFFEKSWIPLFATGFAGFYFSVKKLPTLQYFTEILCAKILVTIPILINTYLAMHVNMPVADVQLAEIDNMMGFNWYEFISFFDDKVWLTNILQEAYTSFWVQLPLFPLVLCLLGYYVRAYQFVTIYVLICSASSIVSIFFPALGTYASLGEEGVNVANINTYFGYSFIEQFNSVRNHPDFILNLSETAGILTFPSVHAAISVLLIWSTWRIIYLRYFVLIWNVIMAISAITHGSHYLFDIVVGCILAVICIVFVANSRKILLVSRTMAS